MLPFAIMIAEVFGRDGDVLVESIPASSSELSATLRNRQPTLLRLTKCVWSLVVI